MDARGGGERHIDVGHLRRDVRERQVRDGALAAELQPVVARHHAARPRELRKYSVQYRYTSSVRAMQPFYCPLYCILSVNLDSRFVGRGWAMGGLRIGRGRGRGAAPQ